MQQRNGKLCVGQVIGTFGGGGAQRLAYNLAVGLADQDVRSVAIALRGAGAYASQPPNGIKLVALEADQGGKIGLLKGLWQLRSLIRREGIDLLHVHGAPSLPYVVMASRLLFRRPRILFTWQDSESVLAATGLRRKLMIWAMRRCADVSGSSQQVAARLREAAGLARVGVFHGSVPVTRACEPDPQSPPVVVWLGRLVPPKDPQALIRAAAALKAEGLKFEVHIVGRPTSNTQWYGQETLQLVRDLGLEDVVKVPGWVPAEDLERLMARASIGVQTSHTEGLSMALLEQMMTGLAVVATDVGDTAAAIADGESGLLIQARQPQQLVDALRRLIVDGELRCRLGRAARQIALEHYSQEKMAARSARHYSEVLGTQ